MLNNVVRDRCLDNRSKRLLFDPSTKASRITERSYSLIVPEPNYVEQDLHQMWEATKQAIRDVVTHDRRYVNVTSLSISSRGGTLIPLAANMDLLGNAIVWMDQRPIEETGELRKKFGDDFFYFKTGHILNCCLPLLQLCRLKKNQPSFFKSIDKFALVGDYITYKLSGEWAIDPSSAQIAQLYNINKGAWDEDLLEIAGITKDQLPKTRDSGEAVGYVSPNLRDELNLSDREVVVSNGGHDHYRSF